VFEEKIKSEESKLSLELFDRRFNLIRLYLWKMISLTKEIILL
jgi:hypothetical protein